MTLARGQSIKIVTEENPATGRIHVANSVVYDVSGETLVLAQTDPALGASLVRKEIIVTYMEDGEKGPVRCGFPAQITGFVDDYVLPSSEKVEAVRATRKADSEPYNIRMYYRVQPTSKNNVSLKVDDKEVTIIDLSLGGVRFSYRRNLTLVQLETVHLILVIDGKALSIEGRILRTWGGEREEMKGELMFASAEFRNVGRAIEDVLSRKLIEIERTGQML